MPASTILLIDADPASTETISTTLTKVGYTVTTSTDPTEALAKVGDHQLVILDVVTGDTSAADVLMTAGPTPKPALNRADPDGI